MSNIKILGVKIDLVTKNNALEIIGNFLHSPKSNFIFTPNPEMLVDAQGDEYFKKVLNHGDLNICDGFGLKLVVPKLKRITGTDFMLEICEMAEKEKKSIYLLGTRSQSVLEKTKANLLKKFPNLNIVGADSGYTITLAPSEQGSILMYNQVNRDECLDRIIMAAPDILFVAFGHNKQEKWIVENVPNLPRVKIAMGVGGAFDYLSGKIKRAPKLLRIIGLEWLWRLFIEPKRIKRIIKATTLFPLFVLLKGKNEN